MAPRILVHAGSSLSSLSPVRVNSTPLAISGPSWEGSVAVRLKDYNGPDGAGERQPREGEELDQGSTWSISFEGRWVGGGEGDGGEGVSADEVLFGNVWQKPIKSYLPYGTSAALRFMRYVDPSLECDLYADKPWALSPLFATLQYMSAREHPARDPLPPFKPDSFPEDLSSLVPSSSASSSLKDNPSSRRSYFSKQPNRATVRLSPSHLVRGDFRHGFIDFETLAVALPGGLSFSLAKYWNGEPVVFSCQRRGTGEQFFVVTFTLEGEGAREAKPEEEEEEEGAEANDDVD